MPCINICFLTAIDFHKGICKPAEHILLDFSIGIPVALPVFHIKLLLRSRLKDFVDKRAVICSRGRG